MNKFVEYFVENDKVLTSVFCGKLFPSWGRSEEGLCDSSHGRVKQGQHGR
jgi:hypothetical protein